MLLAVAGAAVGAGCWPDQPEAAGACQIPPVVPDASDLVVVEAEEPLCEVRIREVVRLEGEVDGIAPRLPVAALPGGGFVSRTYQPGKLAIWDASGRLERVIGRGAGRGPGEFSWVSGLLAKPDGEILVFSGFAQVLRYTANGEYLGQLRFDQNPGGMGRALLADGTVVATQGVPGGRPLVRFDTEGTVHVLPVQTQPGGLIRLFGTDSTFWSSDHVHYEVRRHDAETGEVIFRVRREAEWFPPPTRSLREKGTDQEHDHGSLFDFAVTPEGVIWAEANQIRPQGGKMTVRMEAFTLDGKLLGSREIEADREIHRIDDRFWYRIEDDALQSITILEPVLVERSASG